MSSRRVGYIHLGKGLEVPAHALATSVWTAVGARGSGKTNLCGVVAEQLLDTGIPVIVIDSVGPWSSLRLDPDGKRPSRYQIPVLGGLQGDITLLPTAGRQVAEALAATQSSAVLDISMMSKGERIRFAADFAEAFFEAKKRSPGPVCVIVEEAQRLIPQVMRFPDPNLARCLGAFEEMAEVGRNFGIGVGLPTLRPQKVNKDVLNLAETVFAFRLLGVLERKAIADWVQEKGAPGRDQIGGELPSLARGTAIVWSPGLFSIYGTFALDLKTTYDASSTPNKAKTAIQIKPLDLGALQAAMGKAVEEAKANDPKALRARIAELEKAAAVSNNRTGSALHGVVASATLLNKLQKERDAWKRLADEHAALRDRLGLMAREARGPLQELLKLATDKVKAPSPTIRTDPVHGFTGVPDAVAHAIAKPTNGHVVSARALPDRLTYSQLEDIAKTGRLPAGVLGSAAQKMLNALASTRKPALTRRELGSMCGNKATTGTFRQLLSQLRTRGFITDAGAGSVAITDAGRAAATSDSQPTGGQELLDFWLQRVSGPAGKMLQHLFDQAGEPVSRTELGHISGNASTTGTFRQLLSQLGSNGLIDKPDRDTVKAAALFFE